MQSNQWKGSFIVLCIQDKGFKTFYFNLTVSEGISAIPTSTPFNPCILLLCNRVLPNKTLKVTIWLALLLIIFPLKHYRVQNSFTGTIFMVCYHYGLEVVIFPFLVFIHNFILPEIQFYSKLNLSSYIDLLFMKWLL